MSTLEITPDMVLLISRCGVSGGKRHTREVIRDDTADKTREVEAKTFMKVDDVIERQSAEALAQKGARAILEASASSAIGYLSRKQHVREIEAKLDALRIEAEEFNRGARTCRVEIGMISLEISVALGPDAVRQISEHVQGQLTELRGALANGDVLTTKRMLRPTHAGNLAQLATGMQGQAIEYALDEARSALRALNKAIKANESPESAGRALELPMLDAAIGMFVFIPYVAPEMGPEDFS